MKFLSSTAIAALLVGTMGALSFAPAANADDAAAPAKAPPTVTVAQAGDMHSQDGRGAMGPWGQAGGMHRLAQMHRQLLGIACGDRGAEALEIAFVHIKYDVKPDATQTPLFDALRTAALADQKNFADTCKTVMHPAGGQPGKTTILDRLQTRLTLENAKVAALSDVLPKFKAFYDSLSDQQKAQLEPRWGAAAGMDGMAGHLGWGGQRPLHPGSGGMQSGPHMHGQGTDQNSDETPPPSTDDQGGSAT